MWSYDQVLAVVFEVTGDISVLYKQADTVPAIEPAIFAGVESSERL